MNQEKVMSTRTLVLCAILSALVFVLQFLGSFIRFGPFSVSLVLVPIVIGAASCSSAAGAWLGLVFSIAVFLSGDATAFLAVSVPGTILTVLAKGIACGYAAGLVYNALKEKNQWVAVILTSLVCPLVNTGIFLIGCRIFFWDTLHAWGAELGFQKITEYILFSMIGGNFLFELVTNMILSPVVVRLLKVQERRS